MAAERPDVRNDIVVSLFRKVDANGIPEDNYVSHVKIWEDVPAGTDTFREENGMKPRYIITAVTSSGRGNVYKAKRNSNGSFSIGKRWSLEEVRGFEVVSRSAFNMTIGRTYRWRTERDIEQKNFVIATAHLYTRLHPGQSLNIVGIQIPPVPSINVPSRPEEDRRDRDPGSSRAAPPPSRRSGYDDDDDDRPLRPNGLTPRRRPSRTASPDSPAPSSSRQIVSPQPRREDLPPPRSRTPVTSSYRSSTASNPSPAPPTPRPIRSPRLEPREISPRLPRTETQFSAATAASDYSQTPGLRAPSPQLTPVPRRPSATSISSVPSAAFERTSIPTITNGTSPIISLRPLEPVASASAPIPRPSRTPTPTPPGVPAPATTNGTTTKRDPNARISYFDPGNQVIADRLLASSSAAVNGLNGLASTSEVSPGGVVEDEYGAEATMANVEEMIDGFEWGDVQVGTGKGKKRAGGGTRGAADMMEARLQDELMALEKANIHSFLESDDRVAGVLRLIDQAIAVIDDMDGYVTSYKIQLNSVSDDISFIQSQNRGLQVQTQNQNALLNEINQLLQTVHVDRDALTVLVNGALKTDREIEMMERASAELYKAMQAGRETDMAATMERLDEYRTHNQQFTTRLVGFLSIMFSTQAAMTGPEPKELERSGRQSSSGILTLVPHTQMEEHIGRYSGLVLYMREMDESKYAQLCGTYYSVASEVHGREMKLLLNTYLDLVKKASDDGEEITAFSPNTTSRMGAGIKRTNTVLRSPLDRQKDKDKDRSGGTLSATDAFGRALGQITPQIYREETFIADVLQINDQSITFADYMGLENYFRRQAARSAGISPTTAKLVRGALDLIFGFLPDTLKGWVDAVLAKDEIQLVGIMANLERYTGEAEERGNMFVSKLLGKLSQRMAGLFNHLVDEQVKAIEQTKLSTKKRKGVAHFIKYFPIFVSKIENQLIGADTLEIRAGVDAAYDQIVQVMFESLRQMAKLDGAEAQATEDKGMLNYHVILIENMHAFIAEISQQELGAVQGFLRRAEGIYDENLSAYVKLVMRRPMGKILDYFEGVERLLKTTAPSEVANNSNYNKSSLKRVLKEYSSKDMRRNIEALHKRVEKHFALTSDGLAPGNEDGGSGSGGGSSSVVAGVWRACEEDMLRSTAMFNRLIAQCYAGSNLSLDYSSSEVETYFRSTKTSR